MLFAMQISKDILRAAVCAGFMAAVPSVVQGSGPSRLGENNPLVPPFCETFDNFRQGMEFDDFERYFEALDADNDGRTWGLYNYKAEPYGRCAYLLYKLDLTKPNDDWLVPRAIRLEAGKYYRMSVMAANYSDGSHTKFEVKYGFFPESPELNRQVIEPVDVTSRTFTTSSGWIVPDEDALYYVGIHGISMGSPDYLFIDNIAIDAAREPTVPDAVTDVAFTNNPNGGLEVNVSFSAAAIDISGAPLSGITSIVVTRGDAEVARFENPAPGESLSFVDAVPERGDYEYTFTPSNASGVGLPLAVSHFVGIDAPVAPDDVKTHEIDPSGRVGVTWTAPTTDINGNAINPDQLTYDVWSVTEYGIERVASGITATEAEVNVAMTSSQVMAVMGVTATIGGNTSDYGFADAIPVGEPYRLPYHNSFTMDEYYTYVTYAYSEDFLQWQMQTDVSIPQSQDADNGYVSMQGNQPGQKSELRSGKLDLTAAGHPYVEFYTFVYTGDENIIRVSAIDCATRERTVLVDRPALALGEPGWCHVKADLGAFAGKVIQVCVQGEIMTHAYVAIDNMTVGMLPAVDMGVTVADRPGSVTPGEPFTITALVTNNGAEAVERYQVELLRDGKVEATVDGPALGFWETAEVPFSTMLGVTDPEEAVFAVRVTAEGDANPADNTAESFRVVNLLPLLPVVTDLKAEEDGASVTLTWSEPDVAHAAPEPTDDDFESYQAFTTGSFGGWTTYDADELPIGGFQQVDVPGIPYGSQQSFWVMSNKGDFGFVPAHSGTQAAAQFYCEGGACDDWLISPELYGGRQAVSFWAVSYDTNYGNDTFEVLYSEGGNQPSDFKLIQSRTETSSQWQQYFVVLPEGARYFAIRCTSDNTFMMLVDDASFVGAGEPRQIQLKGYNVYRNGERLNAAPVSTRSFVASRSGDADTDMFVVTTVYDAGESAVSNVVEVGNSGISSVEGAVISAVVDGRDIVVNGDVSSVEVFGVDGRSLYSGVSKRVAVASAGVYIVVADGIHRFKVVVE